MELSVRSYLNAGIALTAASAIALTPVVVSPNSTVDLPVPHISASQVQLAAAINPADVAALVSNLHAAMGSVTSTVSSLVDGSGQTLAGALNSAAGLNNTLWDGLIRAAGANPTLASVMIALKAASAGGLSQLAGSVDAAAGTIALSSGQVAGLLTSTVTGSLGSAMQAVTSIVNDPLSAASYLGLLTTPFGIAGMALQGGINAAATLAGGGVELASTVVTGVTAQIDNALSLVNGLLDAGKSLTDIALIDGTLTAVQGIVSAPVTAALAGVNGLTGAIADVATFTLGAVARGANGVVSTWLGNASSAGALQKALVAIGSAPLSPASYTDAVGVLIGAGFSTVRTVAGTVSSFASLPFRVGADLTNTGAAVITSFTDGLADAASGLLHAAGMSPLISGLPRALATAFSGAVNLAAFTTSVALNAVATAIDFSQAVGGIFDRTSVLSAAAGPAALPTAGLRTALVSTSAEAEAQTAAEATSPKTAEQADNPAAQDDPAAATTTADSDVEPVTDVEATLGSESLPETSGSPEGVKVHEPTAAVDEGDTEAAVGDPAESTVSESVAEDTTTGAEASANDDVSDPATRGSAAEDSAKPGKGRVESSAGAGRHAAATRVGADDADGSGAESSGRHASGATASESSSPSAGRHRSDPAPSASATAPAGGETATGRAAA